MPTLRQLSYLTALADERHFRRAAERVHVTQPTQRRVLLDGGDEGSRSRVGGRWAALQSTQTRLQRRRAKRQVTWNRAALSLGSQQSAVSSQQSARQQSAVSSQQSAVSSQQSAVS